MKPFESSASNLGTLTFVYENFVTEKNILQMEQIRKYLHINSLHSFWKVNTICWYFYNDTNGN